MAEKKEGFIFYKSFYEAIQQFDNNETKLKLFELICRYGIFGEEETEVDPSIKAIMTLVKPVLNRNEELRKNGNKGGRPKKDKNLENTDNQRLENKKPMVSNNKTNGYAFYQDNSQDIYSFDKDKEEDKDRDKEYIENKNKENYFDDDDDNGLV